MATFSKRGKTWQARVYFQGRQISKAGFATKTQAQIWATEIEHQKQNNPLALNNNILVSEYYKEWFNIYKKGKLRPNSFQIYTTIENNILPYFEKLKIKDVNKQHCQKVFNELADKYSESTLKKFKSILTSLFQDMLDNGYLAINPMKKIAIRSTKEEKEKIKFLNEDEIKELITICNKQQSNIADLVLLLLHSGLRVSEGIALSINDFDNDTITINKIRDKATNRVIQGTKTKTSNRTIKIDKKLADYLTKKYKDSPLMFPLSYTQYKRLFKELLEYTHINNSITFHALRHTHASLLLANGVNVQYVSKRLGHSNIAITMSVYIHLLKELEQQEENKTIDIIKNKL